MTQQRVTVRQGAGCAAPARPASLPDSGGHSLAQLPSLGGHKVHRWTLHRGPHLKYQQFLAKIEEEEAWISEQSRNKRYNLASCQHKEDGWTV